MKSTKSLLMLLGLATGLSFAQQPPPPPPPPPPAASNSAPVASPQNNQQQQSQDSVQQTTGQQNSAQQSQQTPSANPTEPTVPAPHQRTGSQEVNELPQSDKMELERIEAEMDRIEAKKQAMELRKKSDSRLEESRAVLRELLGGPAKISNSLLNQAKCVIVIPSVKKVAWAVGMKYGRGVMTCRLGDEFNGPWSAPSMYALESGNVGLQVGLQATDLVLLVMNNRGAEGLLGSKVKLGGDMSVAAGPIGRNMEASTDLSMRAKILAYSRARGIFAGVALDGSTLRPDNNANEALYGREVSAKEIVRRGTVPMPRSARPLIHVLQESSRATADETTSAERK